MFFSNWHWLHFSAAPKTCAATEALFEKTNFYYHMAVSILFFARNGTQDNFFELFAKVFRRFRPRGNFFVGAKIFQILADSAAIRLIQKSSKSEPSSRFLSRLKFWKIRAPLFGEFGQSSQDLGDF